MSILNRETVNRLWAVLAAPSQAELLDQVGRSWIPGWSSCGAVELEEKLPFDDDQWDRYCVQWEALFGDGFIEVCGQLPPVEGAAAFESPAWATEAGRILAMSDPSRYTAVEGWWYRTNYSGDIIFAHAPDPSPWHWTTQARFQRYLHAATTGAQAGRVEAGAADGVGATPGPREEKAVKSVDPVVWPQKAEPLKYSSEGFGDPPASKDLEMVAAAGETVHKKCVEMQKMGMKVIVFVGVGTGNPSSGWKNNSVVRRGGITDASQTFPRFLKEAMEEENYFIIAVNFNIGPSGVVVNDDKGQMTVQVPAKFPLVKTDDGMRALKPFMDVAKAADRFAIMNAVSDQDFEPLAILAMHAKSGAGSYIKSYMQTGLIFAKCPLTRGDRRFVSAQVPSLSSLQQVFRSEPAKVTKTGDRA
ncbi:hypothetical protein OHV05_37815 (plasmid) [Kitasatospora sp. NBC_00070]|uniref:hypothetical protein n=1 Tax=Kitasatospora sp. NBC_00070 TaxID=2975962 RepID=UPI002F907463